MNILITINSIGHILAVNLCECNKPRGFVEGAEMYLLLEIDPGEPSLDFCAKQVIEYIK